MAGNPYVRSNEEEHAPAATPKCRSLLYMLPAVSVALFMAVSASGVEPADYSMPPPKCTAFEPAWSGWMAGASRKCAKFAKGREAFDVMMNEYNLATSKRPDGSLFYDLTKIPPPYDKATGKSFFVNLCSRSTFNANKFYFGVFKHDFDAYRAWKVQYPNFRNFISLEWGNDAYQPFRMPKQLCSQKGTSISEEQLQELLKKMKKPENRDEFVDLLRATYDRIVEWNFSDPKKLLLGDGSDCIGHLAAYWGAGAIGIETTRSYVLYQAQMMFCRGAARQFGIPWMWYIASYIDGAKDGKFVSNCLMAEDNPQWSYHGPRYGISVSAVKRTTYMTYLSGANHYERESMPNTHFLKNKPPVRLSEEGEMYERFHEFCTSVDRGVSYAPIALLVPANRGYTRFGGKAFRLYDYTHPDFMMDAIMSTVLDLPQNWTRANYTSNVERVMCNSRYGDLFDAITPDFKDQTSFKRVIGDYKAAVLVGAYGKNPEMRKILLDYVRNGGVLVLTSAQLDTFPVNLDKARKMSHPAFLQLAEGRGKVIIAKTPYLTPWYGDDAAGQKKALEEISHPLYVRSETHKRYPEIEWLLDELFARFVPVSVSTAEDGSSAVQWGLNRTEDGWLVYLINNGGVTKKWDEYPVFNKGAERAVVDVSKTRCGRVKELLDNTPCEIRNGVVRIDVPYGDIRILKLNR